MRVNDGSICSDCRHFNHECGIEVEDDFVCDEWCDASVEKFNDLEIIKTCDKFKKS